MWAQYLIPNAAWVLRFGDQIIDLDGQRFFTTRESLQHRLAEHGLVLDAHNGVQIRQAVAS